MAETEEVPVSYKLVTARVQFDPKGSRLEALIIRPIWMIPTWILAMLYALVFMVVVMVYAFIASILNMFNWLSLLILGRRLGAAFSWNAKYISTCFQLMTRVNNYYMRRMPYFALMTDRRPALVMEPEPNKEATGSLA